MRVGKRFYQNDASKGKFADGVTTNVHHRSFRLNPDTKRTEPADMIVFRAFHRDEGEFNIEMDARECAALINQLSGALVQSMKRELKKEPVTVGTCHVARMPCPHRREGCTKQLGRQGEEVELCAVSPGGEMCGMLVLKGSQ